MSKIIVNLSVFCSIVLCALCLHQWREGNRFTKEISKLNNDVYTNKVVVQSLEITLKNTKEEVDRLSKIREALEETVKSNLAEIKGLSNELVKVIAEKDAKQVQLDSYKAALEQANSSIKRQNEDIAKQNELLKTVAAQRDQQVEQYKKLVEQFNNTVNEYNKLVEQVKAQNASIEEAQKAAAQKQGGQGSKGGGGGSQSRGSGSPPQK